MPLLEACAVRLPVILWTIIKKSSEFIVISAAGNAYISIYAFCDERNETMWIRYGSCLRTIIRAYCDC